MTSLRICCWKICRQALGTLLLLLELDEEEATRVYTSIRKLHTHRNVSEISAAGIARSKARNSRFVNGHVKGTLRKRLI